MPDVAQGNRVYINILNKCNERCPFCCMFSSPDKNTIMPFETFVSILQHENTKGLPLEVQLEGGEPLMHPELYLFLEYLAHIKVAKITITTNGTLLRRHHMSKLAEVIGRNKIPLVLKISVNHHLIEHNNSKIDYFENLKDMYLATEFIPNFSILFNVRLRANDVDKNIVDRLTEKDLLQHSNIFYLQAYGRFTEEQQYEKPVIVQNIDTWSIYASDGFGFGHDLIERSNHEKEVP